MASGAIPTFDEFKKRQNILSFDDFTPKGQGKPDLPSDFEIGPKQEPSQVRDFFEQALEHAAGIIPGIGKTAKGLTTHPVDTSVGLVRGLGASIVDPFYDAAKGDYGRALEGAAEFALPFIAKGAGAALERGVAEPLAETAAHVRGKSRMFDARPGRAILNETGAAIRPKTVAKKLTDKGVQLGKQLEVNAASSSTPASLTPAVDPINARIAKATGAGATSTAEALQPMRAYFEGEAPAGFGVLGSNSTTGSPLAQRLQNLRKGRPSPTIPNPVPGAPPLINPTQSAAQVLKMRREFVPNFRIKYGPAADSAVNKVGKQAYAGMSGEVKRTVPGATELDPRLHDIMAALPQEEATARGAGIGQRIMERFGAHTGALVGGAAGYHYGGLPGAVAGVVLPEIAASPTLQNLGAKTTYLGAKVMQSPVITVPSTIAGKAIQGARSTLPTINPKTGLPWTPEELAALPRFAKGGIITRPAYIIDAKMGKPIGLMAEKGPEAIVPLPKAKFNLRRQFKGIFAGSTEAPPPYRIRGAS